MKTGREVLWSRVVYALVGEKAGLVRNAFFNWKPIEGREEWRNVVSLLLLEDNSSSTVLNVLEIIVEDSRP